MYFAEQVGCRNWWTCWFRSGWYWREDQCIVIGGMEIQHMKISNIAETRENLMSNLGSPMRNITWPPQETPDSPFPSYFFFYKVHLMQSTMFNCILHHHLNCWLPYSWVSQNNVLGQYSEVSVSCRCPKWRFDYPRLHQAPYQLHSQPPRFAFPVWFYE